MLFVTSAIFTDEDPLLWSTFGGVSIEILIFDPFGVPASWFAPRQLDLWTRAIGVNWVGGGGSPYIPIFYMTHLEVGQLHLITITYHRSWKGHNEARFCHANRCWDRPSKCSVFFEPCTRVGIRHQCQQYSFGDWSV